MMLSAVVVTRNSATTIIPCLASLMEQLAADDEVILVDNASSDGTADLVRRNFPGVNTLQNRGNAGVCSARNQAIAASSGEWVLTLDSDCVLSGDFIRTFRQVAGSCAADTGMVQPEVLRRDGRTVYSQGVYLSLLRRFRDANAGQPAGCRPQGTIGPCAAAALYRRSMLEEIKDRYGYFDERFFFLVEDVDLAWRAHKRGWKVGYMPSLRCFHEGNGSATGLKLRQYLCLRNRYLMINKNERGWSRLRTYALALPYEMCRLAYLAATNTYLWTQKTADWSLRLW